MMSQILNVTDENLISDRARELAELAVGDSVQVFVVCREPVLGIVLLAGFGPFCVFKASPQF